MPQFESFGFYLKKVQAVLPTIKPRPGLALMAPQMPARVVWRGRGKVAPPFFLTRMLNGPTELGALCGEFYTIVATRIRHKSLAFLVSVRKPFGGSTFKSRRWDRNLDDWF